MHDEKPNWESIAPFVVRERQPRELGVQRADRIAAFLRQALNTDEVEVWLRGEHAPGPDYGSCSRFFVYFDESWRPIGKTSRDRRTYSIDVAVSERGPLVVSFGWEWRVAELHPGMSGLCNFSNDEAERRAKSLALSVAYGFGLRYLDAEWLRHFKLSSLVELPLPRDVAESLDDDFSEPDAFSALFYAVI